MSTRTKKWLFLRDSHCGEVAFRGGFEVVCNNLLQFPFISPVFADKPDCELCKSVKKIAARSSANLTKAAFKRRYYDTGYPVLVRNMPAYGDTEHSFEKFMTFFKENQADLELDACEFYTNGALNESVKSLTEFLAEWNHYQAAGKTISWLVINFLKIQSLVPSTNYGFGRIPF